MMNTLTEATEPFAPNSVLIEVENLAVLEVTFVVPKSDDCGAEVAAWFVPVKIV